MLKITSSLKTHKPKTIPNSIGIVAYSGRDWRNELKPSRSKLVFLLKTIASTSSYVSETHVYHPHDENLSFVKDYYPNVYTHGINPPMEIDCGTMVYPIGKYAMLENLWSNFEYVLFNEGDQIIFSNNLHEYIGHLNESNYLSPHRLEKDFNGSNSKNQPIVTYEDVKYVLYNLPKKRKGLFFNCENFWESYGAAWIAKKESVMKADFTKPPKNGLHIPCLSMFNELKALKTANHWDFFVNHLSGYSNALEKSGHNIENFPNYW
jgi:hypothetical protein